MDLAESLLTSWLRPLSVDAFLTTYWTSRAYWSAPDGARLDGVGRVLPTLELPHLLEYADGPIRVWYRDDERPVYGWTLGRRDALHAYRAGLTLYFHLDPAIGRDVIAALSHVLRRAPASFQLSIFAGRRGARTLPHVDGRDNFTLQLHGVKRWRISEGREWPGLDDVRRRGASPAALNDLRRVRRAPEAWDDVPELEMAPGAFLYCPAAHWHTVDAIDESLSLNVSIDDLHTWADDMLPVVRAALLRHDAWRAPGAGLGSDSERAGTVAALLARLGDDLRGLDAADVLTAAATLRPSRDESGGRTFVRNPFVSCELLSVDETREFRVRIESRLRPGQPRVVTLPWESYAPFLELMCARGGHHVNADTDADLVATLVEHGVLRCVAPEPIG